MKIIVGLGNPGQKYQKTRHNVGFLAVNHLQLTHGFLNWKLNKKFNAEIAEGEIDNEKIILVKPQTFMNASGTAVLKLVTHYKLSTENLYIIYDDIDLPLGKIRIRKKGSAGGHKGVQSIIDTLKTENFIRFRIGIRPLSQTKINTQKFVLQKFSKEESKIIGEAIKKINLAIKTALTSGIEKAMTQFN
jgi:PTH1 family peptidyl-tRNA hydrolase